MSNFRLLTTSQNIRLMLGLCQRDPQHDWVLTCEGKCVTRTENDTTVSLWNSQRAQTQPWCCSTAVATPVRSPPSTWAAVSEGLPGPEVSAHWGLKTDNGKNHPFNSYWQKKPPLSNPLAEPTLLQQLGTKGQTRPSPQWQWCAQIHPLPFFFFFPAPNSSVLQHVSQLVKMTHRLIPAFWIGNPIKILLVMYILKRAKSVCSWVSGISIAYLQVCLELVWYLAAGNVVFN